jgi:Rod binding domain-containing protein
MRIAGASSLNAPMAPETKRLEDAARDFEGLLIGQMLKHARQTSSGGWLGTGEDRSSETMMEVAEENLAQILAAQGSFGIAQLMRTGANTPPDPAQRATLTGE